jgi:tetratricopeptide (TPR) repeat protein
MKEREKLRAFVIQSQWDPALTLINESKAFQDKDSHLLQLMEKGMVLHRSSQYQESIENFKKAQDLSRQLFTISLSNKAQTLIANERFDVYYGAPYERSMMHFYQALNYFLLYQGNPQKRQALYSARAELVAWDSMLKQYKKKEESFGLFRNDLLAKLFGGLIHESFHTRDEDQVALQLYKDAYETLLKSYNAYPSFNELSQTFTSHYEEFSGLNTDKILNKYVKPTALQEQLLSRIKQKIVELTLYLFPRDIKIVKKRFSVTDTEIEKWKKAGDLKRSNVVVIVQRRLIPQKVGDRQYIGLDHAQYDSESAKVLSAIGSSVLTLFAAEKLGLTPAPQNWTPVGAHLGLEVSHSLVKGIGFAFELPKVNNTPTRSKLFIEATPKESEKVTPTSKELPLVQPLGDLAEQAVARDSLGRYARVGTRLLVKHLSALAASYVTYQALNSKNDKNQSDQFAAVMASLQYVAASKAIESSEKADTRYWSSLPGEIRIIDFWLPPGEHQITLNEQGSSGENLSWDLGVAKVPEEKQGKIFLNTFIP